MPRQFNTQPVNNANELLNNEEKFSNQQLGAGSSALDSFASSWLGTFAGIEDINRILNPTPAPPALNGLIEHIQNQQAQIPSSNTKTVGDFVGNIAGFATNPLSLAGGEVGGAAAGAALRGAADLLPESASLAVDAGFGDAGTVLNKAGIPTLAKDTGIALGATELATVNDAYDEKSNSINVPDLMNETMLNGALGLGFGGAQVLHANIRAKLKAAKIDADDIEAIKSAAAKGVITPETADLYEKTQKAGANFDPELQPQIQAALKREGLPDMDAMGSVNIPVLSHEDMQNIQSVLPYELAANTSDDFSPKLSNYIVQNSLDKATSNEGLMSSLKELLSTHKQMIDNLEAKVSKNLDESAKLKTLLQNRESLRTSLDEHLMSQKNLYEAEVKGTEHPYYVPNNVAEKASLARRIEKLKNSFTGNKTIQKRINKLQTEHDAIELKRLPDEVSELYDKSTANDISGGSDEYYRLQDLAKNEIPLARTLADIEKVRAKINQQKELANFAQGLTEYSNYRANEAPKNKLTDLVNYARNMIESKVVDSYKSEYEQANNKIIDETSMMDDSEMSDFAQKAKESDEELGSEIEQAMSMYDKIKQSGKVFEDFMKCLRG